LKTRMSAACASSRTESDPRCHIVTTAIETTALAVVPEANRTREKLVEALKVAGYQILGVQLDPEPIGAGPPPGTAWVRGFCLHLPYLSTNDW
jgi:hypothetical protein